MPNQALSPEQMRELIKLGVDTSKATMFRHPSFYRVNGILDYDRYEDIPRIKLQNNYNLDYDILAFTLQDILDILNNTKKYVWTLNESGIILEDLQGNEFHREHHNNLMQAAFNMLKWCKENNYI